MCSDRNNGVERNPPLLAPWWNADTLHLSWSDESHPGASPGGATMTNKDFVSVYRCTCCGNLRVIELDNHHPYCNRCVWDVFDWSNGIDRVDRATAQQMVDEDNN